MWFSIAMLVFRQGICQNEFIFSSFKAEIPNMFETNIGWSPPMTVNFSRRTYIPVAKKHAEQKGDSTSFFDGILGPYCDKHTYVGSLPILF